MDDCIFCKLANGVIPTQLIYEDEHVVAFHDLHPVAPVHVLVMPRVHVRNIADLADHPEGEAIMGQVLRAIPQVARIVGVDHQGYRIINNCGHNGGQTIDHVHFHLIGGQHLGDRLV